MGNMVMSMYKVSGLKGISPLVATVIVLAFTIAVAGIVGVFLTGFATTQTSAVGGGGQKLTQCAGSALKFETVKVFCRTGAGTSWLNATVSYITGSKSLSNLSISFSGGGFTQKISNFTEFLPGDFYAWTINLSSYSVTCPVDSVRVAGTCLNETLISTDCNKGDPCYSQVFA